MGSVIVSGVLTASRPLDPMERTMLRLAETWELTTLDRVVPSAGVAPAIASTNPTKALAAYTETMDVLTRSGIRGAATVGAPSIGGHPWGWGAWGANGPWGAWGPIMLHLRSETNDVVLYDPTGIIAPESGSIAFRFWRYEDPGTLEPVMECGEDGAAWLRVYIDASDYLTVAWSFGGAAATTVVATDTFTTDQRYIGILTWNGTDVSLSWGEVNAYGRTSTVTTVTGTRDTPSGTWNGAPLVMRAA